MISLLAYFKSLSKHLSPMCSEQVNSDNKKIIVDENNKKIKQQSCYEGYKYHKRCKRHNDAKHQKPIYCTYNSLAAVKQQE